MLLNVSHLPTLVKKKERTRKEVQGMTEIYVNARDLILDHRTGGDVEVARFLVRDQGAAQNHDQGERVCFVCRFVNMLLYHFACVLLECACFLFCFFLLLYMLNGIDPAPDHIPDHARGPVHHLTGVGTVVMEDSVVAEHL